MIEKLTNNILINDSVKSVYTFNDYSIQDLLSKFFEKINNCVEVSNKALDFLTYLKEEGLPNEVIKELEIMYSDGRLTNLINDFLNDIKGKVDNIEINVLPNLSIDGGVL